MIKTEYEVYYQLREEVAEKLHVPGLIKIIVKPDGMKIEDYAPLYFSVLYDLSYNEFEVVDILYWDGYDDGYEEENYY